MAPIPINSDKPINTAQKAAGQTPQTSESTSSSKYTPATTTASSTSQYTPAAPGAAAAPAPTGSTYSQFPPSVAPPPTRTTDLPPPQSDNGPPQPQPGAVPQPPTTTATAQTSTPIHPAPSTTHPPPQFSIPPPTTNYAPTKSTIPSTTPSQPNPYAPAPTFTNPTTDPTDPTAPAHPSLSHPPGYHQNPNALEMTSAQRALQSEREAQESYLPGLGSGSVPGPSGTTSSAARGGEGGLGEMAGSAWSVAKAWAGNVVEKAEEVENAVWRRVNEGK